MTNPIVVVSVSQTQAPTPNNLQRTGALISQGGTVLTAGSRALLTQLADLTPLLAAGLAVTSASYSNGVVTVTTTAAHGIAVNTIFPTTLAGFVPSGYNGTYFATATGASTFTYYLSADPGATVTTGTYTPPTVAELQAMASNYFNQKPGIGAIYVLELGAGSAAAGVSFLTSYIAAQDQLFYSYEVPRSWADESTFLTMVGNFTSTTAKTYFFVTVNSQNWPVWSAAGSKSVLAMIEAPKYSKLPGQTVTNATWTGNVATITTAAPHGILPNDVFTLTGILATGTGQYNGTFIAIPGTTGSTLKYSLLTNPGTYSSGGALLARLYGSSAGIPATEFDASGPLFTTLNWDPSPVNKPTPLVFSPLVGMTQFPTMGNRALIQSLDVGNINYVGTGAEGGISGTILYEGHTLDGRPFNYWYYVDWMQINAKQTLANAVINGSQVPFNPLIYNQDGIDRLQLALVSMCNAGVSDGMVLGQVIQTSLPALTFQNNLNRGLYNGQCVVNAVPFTDYLTGAPSDYKLGIYNGFSIVFTPTRAFEHIQVNINVTDFVTT